MLETWTAPPRNAVIMTPCAQSGVNGVCRGGRYVNPLCPWCCRWRRSLPAIEWFRKLAGAA